MTIKPDRVGVYDYTFTKVVSGDTSYFTAHVFCFQGTKIFGTPLKITIICGYIDNTTQSVRIYDTTNNKVICERTNITSAFPTAEDMGALSNIPEDPSLWEVQIKRVSGPGGAKEVAVASLHMDF